MKKASVLFLLSIFLFNTAGYYIAFKVVQFNIKREVKSEIKQGLDLKSLIKITVNKHNLSEVEFLDNGKEIRYKGELHDIVKSINNVTSVTYYCIKDSQEEKLFSNLDEHINRHIAADKPIKNNAAKKLVDHVVKLYFPNQENFKFDSVYASVLYLFKNDAFLPIYLVTDSIPPELA